MKKIVLSLLLCLMASAFYSQTIDVIHLKSGLDARGTIISRTESQITVQTENGRTLSFDMTDIDSMEQEQKVFDPKVLIGRWACYKADGKRDRTYDMVISENEGFYSVRYVYYINYFSNDQTLLSYPHDTPESFVEDTKDIDVEDGKVYYHFWQLQHVILNYSKSARRQRVAINSQHCDIDLKYIDGKLKGSIDCTRYYQDLSCEGYDDADECGTVFADGPGGKWNVYFVKY